MAHKGRDTRLYRWTQQKDELTLTIKPPLTHKIPSDHAKHTEEDEKTEIDRNLGAKVVLHGLQRAQKLNYGQGEIVGPLQKGRYRVRLENSDRKEVNVKPVNLALQPNREEVHVNFKSKELTVAISGRVVLHGSLRHLIVTDECTWFMANGLPQLLLSKQHHDWWEGVLEGDEEIDVAILEAETFMDEKMVDRLKSRQAKTKREELKSRDSVTIEELEKHYLSELNRETKSFEKNEEGRAFLLWTKKARKAAGLSLDYRTVANVCSPIRCVEHQNVCSLRSKVTFEEMDRFHEEARREVKRIHFDHMNSLRKCLEIVKGSNPLSTTVYQSAVINASPDEVWRCVFPIGDCIVPGRLLRTTCSAEHPVGSTFKVTTKAKTVETFILTGLSHNYRRVSFSLVARSRPFEAASVSHTIELKSISYRGEDSGEEGKVAECCGTFVRMQSWFSSDVSPSVLARSNVDKLEYFQRLRRVHIVKLRQHKHLSKILVDNPADRNCPAEIKARNETEMPKVT